jgi:Zn-dependent peptidase ImmA (M78 family)
VLILILLTSLIFYKIGLNQDKQKIIFDLTINNITGDYSGFYYHSHYFCVITKDRSKEDIMETTIHELTHYLIDEDYQHFCKNE